MTTPRRPLVSKQEAMDEVRQAYRCLRLAGLDDGPIGAWATVLADAMVHDMQLVNLLDTQLTKTAVARAERTLIKSVSRPPTKQEHQRAHDRKRDEDDEEDLGGIHDS